MSPLARSESPRGIKINHIVGVILTLFCLIFLGCAGGSLTENLNASDIMVVQYLNGNMETYSTPGWKPQWFGKVTKYQKRTNYDFLAPGRGSSSKEDHSIKVRFNDAGEGNISGSIAWEMPRSKETILRLHSLYGSQEAVERQLVSSVVNKAVYMTGPLMSSRESYAERRNELLSLIDDQIQHGVYRTRTIQRKEVDPIDENKEKIVQVVELVRDSSGNYARQDHSPLEEFDIKTFNLSINGVVYNETVEGQIKQQQAMAMQIQTAMVESKTAQQAALTAEQNGKAAAAKAKWEQEVIKTAAVTEAEKDRDVARLDAEAAEQEKRADILRGEGQATAQRLEMQANGALEQKLEAWKEVNLAYAEAIANYKGAWVPSTVMGGGSGGGNGAQAMIDLFTVKTARDLNLDMRQESGGK